MKLATGQHLMFVRTAYMSEYKGITKNDKPYNGSSYLEDSQLVNEANNFKSYQNLCYGFFMIQGDLNLKRLGGSKDDDYVDDILVIIVASSPQKGSLIIGWYDHARVYKKTQQLPKTLKKDRRKLFNMRAEAKDCFLVPERERIKLFPDDFPAKMRRNFNWYAEDKEDKKIVERAIKFMESKTIKYTNPDKKGLWKNINN